LEVVEQLATEAISLPTSEQAELSGALVVLITAGMA